MQNTPALDNIDGVTPINTVGSPENNVHLKNMSTQQYTPENPDIFWSKYSDRRHSIQDYKTLSEFYLTSNRVQRGQRQFDQEVIKNIQNLNYRKLDEIGGGTVGAVEFRKNIFQQKFHGRSTVRDTIKSRVNNKA